MPIDASAVLGLPYIQPSQAQKHVTHNEALRLLDLLVQMTVFSRSQTAPPGAAEPGARYLVPASPGGDFAGQEGRIAVLEETGWSFLAPQPGWRAHILDEAADVIFDGSIWTGESERFHQVAGLGIMTVADETNRLAVAGPASLLTHAGAGHQLKINKAASGDTASLLFQTGWSGRAEMGTAGSDDFEIKTSADGTTFFTAFQARGTDGKALFPAGLQAGSGSGAAPGIAFSADPGTGISRPGNGQMGFSTAGARRMRLSSATLEVNVPLTGSAVTADAADDTAGRLLRVGAGPGQLDPGLYHRDNLLGGVSQSAGVPTGAVIESGGNADGSYIRLADGTQICTHVMIAASDTASIWNFPADFAGPPNVTGTAIAPVLAGVCLEAAPSAMAVGFSTRDKDDARRADPCHLQAIGRWF
ncbi:MAG: DUF2793 domain-containing protein [Pseudorhodobacter sp.]